MPGAPRRACRSRSGATERSTERDPFRRQGTAAVRESLVSFVNFRESICQALRMDFDLSPEHELLRATVRQFALERVAPVAEELDREKRFPYELVAELAELGLMG